MKLLSRINNGRRNMPPLNFFLRDRTLRVGRPFNWESRGRIKIGQRTQIREHSWLVPFESWAGETMQTSLLIGSDVYIGRYFTCAVLDRVEIGDGCVISEHVYITDGGHATEPLDVHIFKRPMVTKGPVIIGKSCFIGYGARLLPGAGLGDHCVVGANAVVNRPFPAYSMIAGSPARLIKTFNHDRGMWCAPEDTVG